jgi:hypothetical protein
VKPIDEFFALKITHCADVVIGSVVPKRGTEAFGYFDAFEGKGLSRLAFALFPFESRGPIWCSNGEARTFVFTK